MTSVAITPSPSGFGQAVTATATVAPTNGGGSVAFSLNGNPVPGCSAKTLTVGGTATCSLPSLELGQNVVRAVYSGDAQLFGSSGQATTTVGKGTTTLTASPALLVKGKNGASTTTLKATLSAYAAPVTGRTVAFSSAGTALCSAVTDSTGIASCTLAVPSSTMKSLQKNGYAAAFAGDAQYLSSSAHAGSQRLSGTCSIPSASACAGGDPPMNRERVDDTECERKADQDDERPEQLAPGRLLAADEPRGEDPDHRHEQGEGRDCRGWVARQQPYQTPYPKKVETTTTYARAAIPDALIEEAALCQRAVPSKISESPSSGTGATTLDQTRSEKGRFGLAARVTTLPQPHAAAEAIPSATA